MAELPLSDFASISLLLLLLLLLLLTAKEIRATLTNSNRVPQTATETTTTAEGILEVEAPELPITGLSIDDSESARKLALVSLSLTVDSALAAVASVVVFPPPDVAGDEDDV